MRISVINNFVENPDASPEIQSIVTAGKRQDIVVEVIDIPDLKKLAHIVESIGDVVIYRTASAPEPDKRKKIFEAIRAKRILINEALGDQPWLRHKIYQQQVIAEHTDIPTIPTFQFLNRQELALAVAEQQLRWPIIQKPNGGVRGRDITLATHMDHIASDQTIRRFVYQPFIRNEGDYRVLVIDHHIIAMMKRVAGPTSFLNNISQGANAYPVTDPDIRHRLSTYALKINEVLKLDFIGVDIIQDTDNGTYYFLEVNLMPGWQGLVRTTGVDVGAAVIEHCRQRYQEQQRTGESVDKNNK